MVHQEILEHRVNVEAAKKKVFMYLVARVTANTRDILDNGVVDDPGLVEVAFRELEGEEVARAHHSVPDLWEKPEEVYYSLTGRGMGNYLPRK